MKKINSHKSRNKIYSVFFFLVLFFTTFSNSFAQEPRTDIQGKFLLKTKWGSNDLYCKFTPGQTPLGCHSLAIAQVLYFHKLAPSGKVSYQCSDGHVINEDFTGFKADWNKISGTLDEASGAEAINATAFYNYAVACIVQKDFSTDNYIGIENSNNHKSQVEGHFKCRYESYVYNNETSIADLFRKDGTFESLIKKEIDAGRPVGFYYMWDQNGHAVAVDGYTVKDGKFYVHANFGWMGHSDGWYLLPVDMPPGTHLIMLLTIEPAA